ncbi:nephrin-like [Penaeus chinensis]|uniref:nephrin-like n=1 Tax=Penaeus chinensis TaxID=139456 RepID=UPI001FB5A531|nr:nephrin-like [Penaeus chinensis]
MFVFPPNLGKDTVPRKCITYDVFAYTVILLLRLVYLALTLSDPFCEYTLDKNLFVVLCGVTAEEQMFLVTPKSVQVKAGDDVFFRCVVRNQQGNAQWTKDGFALGFSRTVPGYPRYRYAGDSVKGEHHLIIKGVTLQDDGEYQCQVGPTANASAIWAAANLTVMVAPRSISLGERQDGAVEEVKEGERITLECYVRDARPAPSVAWYRSGLKLDSSLHEEEVRASSQRRRWSVRSRLSLRPGPEDDTQQYSCRALHPALEDSPTTLVASVVLSVLHAPSAPTIRGYKTGEVLVAGDERTLTCEVVGGNPRPRVAWYRHGRPLNTAHKPTKRRVSGPELRKERVVTVNQDVTATRLEDGAVYECRVTTTILPDPISATVTLTVHSTITLKANTAFKGTLHNASACNLRPWHLIFLPTDSPTHVNLSGPEVVRPGQHFSLTCTTSPANPPAVIAWMIQGAKLYGGRLHFQDSDNCSALCYNGSGGGRLGHDLGADPTSPKVTQSHGNQRVVLEITRTWLCIFVTNIPSVSATLSLTCLPAFLFISPPFFALKSIRTFTRPLRPPPSVPPPERPGRPELKIERIESTQAAGEGVAAGVAAGVEVGVPGRWVAGEALRFACSSEGGNPPPVITWVVIDPDFVRLFGFRVRMYLGKKELELTLSREDSVSSAWAEEVVMPSDNKKQVTCKVTSPGLSAPLTAHAVLDLLSYTNYTGSPIPPLDITGWATPSSAEPGQDMTLTCESSSSLPPSTIAWHSQGQRQEGAIVSHSPGAFGGTVSRSELVVQTDGFDHGRTFTCEATNGLGVTVSTNITVNLLRECPNALFYKGSLSCSELLQASDATRPRSPPLNHGSESYMSGSGLNNVTSAAVIIPLVMFREFML